MASVPLDAPGLAAGASMPRLHLASIAYEMAQFKDAETKQLREGRLQPTHSSRGSPSPHSPHRKKVLGHWCEVRTGSGAVYETYHQFSEFELLREALKVEARDDVAFDATLRQCREAFPEASLLNFFYVDLDDMDVQTEQLDHWLRALSALADPRPKRAPHGELVADPGAARLQAMLATFFDCDGEGVVAEAAHRAAAATRIQAVARGCMVRKHVGNIHRATVAHGRSKLQSAVRDAGEDFANLGAGPAAAVSRWSTHADVSKAERRMAEKKAIAMKKLAAAMPEELELILKPDEGESGGGGSGVVYLLGVVGLAAAIGFVLMRRK